MPLPRKVEHSNEIIEIFPVFLERLTKDPSYSRSALGVRDERDFAELVRWNKFMELFFLTASCEFINDGPNSGAKTFQ